jgi:uncharacterized protein (TIGR00369 family)
MERQPNSRMCFVCGRQNPVGLRLKFLEDVDSHQVRCEFAIPAEYQGYPGVVHGGIVASVLDEVAGRAVMLGRTDEVLMATLRMTVRYRRPTPTETSLVAVGWVERISAIGARVAGEIRLPDGTVTAECEAVVANMPDEFRSGWEVERTFWRVDE